jgi:hypothetical protein
MGTPCFGAKSVASRSVRPLHLDVGLIEQLFLFRELGLSEVLEAVAESLDKEREFFGVFFGGGAFGDLVPVRVGELRTIRVALLDHPRTPLSSMRSGYRLISSEGTGVSGRAGEGRPRSTIRIALS